MEDLITNIYKLGNPRLLGAKDINEALHRLNLYKSSLGFNYVYTIKDDSTIIESVGKIDQKGFVLLLTGFQALQSNNIQEAQNIVNEVLTMHPQYSEGYRLSSYISDHLGDYEKSMKDAETAINCDGKNTFAWLQKGRLLLDIDKYKNYDSAKSCFEQCVNIDPYMYEAYHDLGLVSLRQLEGLLKESIQGDDTKQKLYEESYDFFRKSSILNPRYFANYPRIARLQLLHTDFEQCLSFIEETMNWLRVNGFCDIAGKEIKILKQIYAEAQSALIKQRKEM
ncbi:MAG: hypothetical protein J6X31_04305 [Bacteroidales bacterium]|nr:hypothetical protein [Bacteroidales bacterium]